MGSLGILLTMNSTGLHWTEAGRMKHAGLQHLSTTVVWAVVYKILMFITSPPPHAVSLLALEAQVWVAELDSLRKEGL